MQRRLRFWTVLLLTLALLSSSLQFIACGNGPAPSDDTTGAGADDGWSYPDQLARTKGPLALQVTNFGVRRNDLVPSARYPVPYR